jgi:hypothetical protein
MALPQPHEGATALVTCSLHGRHFPDTISLPISKRAWRRVG